MKKPQAKKPLTTGRNPKFNEAMREKRNLTVPSKKVYSRKSKHQEW